jgi:type IV pilus assembly protein PilW
MRSRQHGMSLVEVLVAVAIGLIGILIITQAYLTGESFNRSTLGEGGAQTNGTIALFSIERDLRQAGYGIADSRAFGCGNIKYYVDPDYSLNAGGTLPNVSLAPVSITTTAGQPDQITVMYASAATRLSPTAVTMPAAAGQFKVNGTYGFFVGDVVLAVNLAGAPNCSLRKITAVSPGTAQLTYNPGSSGEYNPPPAGNGLLPTYVKDDLLFDLGQLRRRNFAIVNNNLRATDSLLSDGTTSTLDVVDGIVDMRAQYGKDNGINNGTITNTAYVANDGIIDGYDTTAPVTAADWAQVLAVRVGVLARIGNFEKPSVSGGNCDATTVLPTWSGSAASPFNAVDIATVTSEARCFRYRVFETVVPLRNMIWRAS